MNQSKQITDGAIFTAIYIILILLIIFIPFLSTFVLFLIPVPFIIYTSMHGYKPAVVMVLAAFLLTSIVATLISIPLTLLATFGGITIGHAIYKGKDAYTTLAFGTMGFIISLVGIFILTELVFSVHIYSEIDALIAESLETSKSLLQNLPNSIDTDETFKLVEEQMYGFKDLIPGLVILLALAMSFISQWAGYKVLNRIKGKKLYFSKFADFNFPISLIWVYLITIILSFINLDQGSTLYLAYVNAELICVTFLFIQGLSFLFFYFNHKKINRVVPIILTVISFLIPLFMYIIRIIGIIDLGFSLKKQMMNQGKS